MRVLSLKPSLHVQICYLTCDLYCISTCMFTVNLHVTSNQHACDEAGTRSRLGCVATRGCWYNNKVTHCTKKYWRTSTTMGKYEYARQFFSIATYAILSVLPCSSFLVTLRLCPSVSPSPAVYPSHSLFGSLLLQLTLRLHSPDYFSC